MNPGPSDTAHSAARPAIAASLIIVSRHRSTALLRALKGVAQMDHPEFEVIVVADPQAAAAVRAAGWQVKLCEFDLPNISAARNQGLAMASADVVAFLDDDAVPEPTWLRRLVAPFADKRVTAAGGYVRGRSGLAWQWRAMRVDRNGIDHGFDPGPETSLHDGNAALAVKTQGTNCAFRRDALLAIGGFDTGYAFFLDEADVNLRLAARGGLTAVVPDAVVHHGFAASARRRADRVPTDLTGIGRSIAYFLRRHGGTATAHHVAEQRARLLRHMIAGRLEPRDVTRLMEGFHSGLKQGAGAELSTCPPLPATTLELAPLPGTGPRAGCFIAGPARDRARLEKQAKAAVAEGRIVTVLCMSRGIRPHRHFFADGGWWEQAGGRFGPSERSGNLFIWTGCKGREDKEKMRLISCRPV